MGVRGRGVGMVVYSLALGLALTVSAPWWAWRMVVDGRYREGLGERLGRVPARLREAARGRRVVWVHAVSVGEVLAAAGMVGALERRMAVEGAGWQVVVSTTTRTGQALARERFGVERVFWFPLDFGWAVRAWLRALRPAMVVLVESELWPRLLAECERAGVPVVVANARMSDRSYRRARKAGWVWRGVLRRVELFLAQSVETAERLRGLGIAAERVRVAGNLKYDVAPRQTALTEVLRPLLAGYGAMVAGSLLEGEEAVLLRLWGDIATGTGAVLVLAPRHPERFEAVARMVAERGFRLARASELRASGGGARMEPGTVLLLDTVGDLAAVYGLAAVAFVGGSLVAKGGHNPLEPARFGVPVVMGRSYENFREVVGEMVADGGIEIVGSGDELGAALRRLLKDRVAADELGQRGLRVFARKQGATERMVDALVAVLRGALGGGTA